MKKNARIVVIIMMILLNTNQNIAQDKIEWTGADEQKLMGLFNAWVVICNTVMQKRNIR